MSNMDILRDVIRHLKQIDSVYDVFRVLPRK